MRSLTPSDGHGGQCSKNAIILPCGRPPPCTPPCASSPPPAATPPPPQPGRPKDWPLCPTPQRLQHPPVNSRAAPAPALRRPPASSHAATPPRRPRRLPRSSRRPLRAVYDMVYHVAPRLCHDVACSHWFNKPRVCTRRATNSAVPPHGSGHSHVALHLVHSATSLTYLAYMKLLRYCVRIPPGRSVARNELVRRTGALAQPTSCTSTDRSATSSSLARSVPARWLSIVSATGDAVLNVP